MNNKKIAYFEIFLIVSFSISLSWIAGNIYGRAPSIEGVLDFLLIIPSVSAQTLNQGITQCCIDIRGGETCLDLPRNDCSNLCDSSCIPNSCDKVSQCQLGCGFSKSEGLCTPNIPKRACDNDPDCEFIEERFCSDNKCNRGCCILGLEAKFTTRTSCEIFAERSGLPMEFDSSITDEIQCLKSVESLEEGACTFNIGEEKDECKFTTKSDCDQIQGDFYKGYLCSNPSLNTRCEKQKSSNCVDGRDEVYWFDSCGNRENIYSSDKSRSWNNGMILKKSESCSPSSNNADSSSCGNCNYNLGSTCGEFRPGVDRGNLEGYTCRNLNCKASDGTLGKSRTHGESWCTYDGPIGSLTSNIGNGIHIFNRIEGINLRNFRGGDAEEIAGDRINNINILGKVDILSTDLVGSRHFRRVCNNGEVEVEPCADFRQEICVQNQETVEGRKIDQAICRVNLWEQCLSYNGGSEEQGCGPACLAKCVNNPDCRVHPINVDTNFKFNVCVPKYPPGFDLGSTSGLQSFAQGYASDFIGSNLGEFSDIASQLGGSLSSEISGGNVCSLASQTCTSVWTKTCGVSGVQWECVQNCNCHNAIFTAQMNNLCASLGDCGVYSNIQGKTTFLGASVNKKGSHGKSPIRPLFLVPVYSALSKVLKPNAPSGAPFTEESDILSLSIGILDPFLDGYNRVKPSAPSQLGNLFGSQLGNTIVNTAIIAQLGTWPFFAFTSIGLGPLFIAGIALGIGLQFALGCGKTETVDITFQCLPWERPKGGKDCEKCNDDPLKPCSKYRCESLGNRCTLINEGQGDECISIEGESGVPIISPWGGALNKSLFSYQNVSSNGFMVRTKNNECIEQYTALSFGVETNIYSNCRWEYEATGFENMTSSFLEGNLFTKNHTLITVLPSAYGLIANEINPGESINSSTYEYLLEQVGDLNLYVKCANIDGVENSQNYRINFCVDPGPDLQDPVIVNIIPNNGSSLAFNSIYQDVAVFVSEPADCKWDVNQPPIGSESYSSLANEFSCANNIEDVTLFGFVCNTTLPITQEKNKFFIQCKDQPWLGNNESRNVGNIFEYVLKKSESELKIDEVEPSGTITAGTEPISVTISAKTSGGVDSGNSICEYGLENGFYISQFLRTNSNEHSQILNQLTKGNYTVYVKCTDRVGNVALGESSFSLELDTKEPTVTRVFSTGNSLMIITSEDASCYYRNDSGQCNFPISNSSEFDSSGNTHSTPLIEEQTYYIKCLDVWSNSPDECSIIVKPYNL